MSCGKSLRLVACAMAVMLLSAAGWVQADHHEEASADMAAMMENFMKAATPGEQHSTLADLEGTYKLTIRSFQGAGEPQVSYGTVERTMTLEGRVLQETMSSDMGNGMTFHGLGRTGYDNVTGKYWSTWTDTMSTGLYTLTGTRSDDGKQAEFEGEGPDPMSGGMKALRIETELKDDGTEVSRFYQPGPDGNEIKTMVLVYERAE